MTNQELKQHLLDFLKGFAGAVAAAAALAAVNFLGAHVPDVLSLLTTWAGGIVGIKAGR